jgi:hypothetical protein
LQVSFNYDLLHFFKHFRASNELGTAEVSLHVIVIQKPNLADTTTDVIKYEFGETGMLDCPIKNRTFGEEITW